MISSQWQICPYFIQYRTKRMFKLIKNKLLYNTVYLHLALYLSQFTTLNASYLYNLQTKQQPLNTSIPSDSSLKSPEY